MARKKTPPEYGLSPYCYELIFECGILELLRGGAEGGARRRQCMIVRLNIQVPLLLLASETIARDMSALWDRNLDKGFGARSLPLGTYRTRSSPMGPAEHDEGGSLSINKSALRSR